MLRFRRFEEKRAELDSAGKILGFLHLCVGQEAVAVGVMRALEPDDAVVSTYREHGHALARGVSSEAITGGCCRGRASTRTSPPSSTAPWPSPTPAPLEPVEDLLKDVRGRSLCRTRSSP